MMEEQQTDTFVAPLLNTLSYEMDVQGRDVIKPEDSVSQTGSRTSRVSSAAGILRLEDARKEAELNARMAAFEENRMLEQEKHRIKIQSSIRARELELERLKLDTELQQTLAEIEIKEKQLEFETEIEVVKAKTRVTEDIESDTGPSPLRAPISRPTYKPITSTPHMASADQGNASTILLASALDTLADKLSSKATLLPRMMPEKFNGEYMEYPLWIKAFESQIEQNAETVSQKLYFLKRCTGGEAYEAIKGLLAMNTEHAYEKAKSVLKNRYGDEYLVSRHYLRKIKEWTPVKIGEGKALREFSDFLNNCLATKESSHHLQCLDSEDQIILIMGKLPRNISDRWSRLVDTWLHGSGSRRYPPFSELCSFLEREARIACNAINLKDEPQPVKQKVRVGQRGIRATGSFTTRIEECPICKRKHNIEECHDFITLNWEERREALKKRGLCYGCMQDRHLIKACKRRRTCDKCKGLHPTLLHRERRVETQVHATNQEMDNEETIESAASLNTNVDVAGHYHSLIVPVYVTHEDEQPRVMTYALLDEQSNSTFVSKCILKKLGLQGRPTKIKLTTMTSSTVMNSEVVKGLNISGVGSNWHGKDVNLKSVYVRDCIPVQRELIPKPESAKAHHHLERIADKMMPYREDIEVGLLIGLDCSEAIKPRELISGPGNTPWAIRTRLGWGIAGLVDQVKLTTVSEGKSCHIAFRTHAVEVSSASILKMFNRDFNELDLEGKMSVEDRRFMETMEKGIHRTPDGHFEVPLPLKNKQIVLPNNKAAVEKRLNGLKSRLNRNDSYKRDYCEFMNTVIDNGFAEEVPESELDMENGQVWYIPHHGIYHPKKPDKIRVVFDCSMESQGQVLNKHLLQGPDQTNNLTGVLCRFRQEDIAISCDIEGMFHQVKVNKEHRNFLRFLWWKDGDLTRQPKEYRMTVHLFGATSSPGCVNYTLKHLATTNENEFGSDTANFIRRDFYVDDGLKSVATEAAAVKLISSTHALCAKGGFHLHKFISNNKAVLSSVPNNLKGKNVQKLNLECDSLPIERTLGIEWAIELDCFSFRITVNSKPSTRRGILSTVSSIFDPLGLVSPFTMVGKRILQDVIREQGDWDDPVPEDMLLRWEQWLSQVPKLANIQIPRCYKRKDFGTATSVELHHFSDASLSGYGQCSYLRLVNEDGVVNCALVIGKSRVPPTKPVTVPRLELTAAVVSAKVSKFLDKELDYGNVNHYFWTDSKVVLSYISNEARRFHIFVANRVQQIRDYTDVGCWNFVQTGDNPADIASRGATVNDLQNCQLWWNGPHFLWESVIVKDEEKASDLSSSDPEVRHKVVMLTQTTGDEDKFDGLLSRLEYFSSWFRAKRAVAVCLRFMEILKAKRVQATVQTRQRKRNQRYQPVTLAELQKAELMILQKVQSQAFSEEVRNALNSKNIGSLSAKHKAMEVKSSSSLYRLDPFIGEDGLIRVGGRIRRADIPRDIVFPVVLPKKHHVSNLIVDHHHKRTQHSGRGITLSEIRSSGYWILGGRSVVASCIGSCVKCKKYRGATVQQKMADLPVDRLDVAEPFRFSAVDFFGPFYIREGRSERKRWGVIFVCMASRAVHVETANSLNTDSFINAYRRFTARRGQVQQLRSDRGTNFVGAKSEQQAALREMNNDKIRQALLKDSCDWINFKMNVPQASHMGGSWERMIRSVRSVFNNLLDAHAELLDDELLRTLLTEAEAIVNSRPITYEDTTSVDSGEPLSPHQLLTLKSRIVLPPPGDFQTTDLYCRKRWRIVQYLANQFWTKWKREYLSSLQERKKWNKETHNLCIGDIVLVKDECTPRGQWPLGRIVKLFPSEDHLCRKVTVKIGNSEYERPVQKLVHIFRPGHPTRSHENNS